MSPGSVTERLHFFAAEVDPYDRRAAGGGSFAEGEDIEVVELPLAAALAAIEQGRIVDGKTIMLLYHAKVRGLMDRLSPGHPMPAPRLDWDHVRVFLAVARAGGQGRAAAGLQQSEATIGRHLAALEAALAAPLFDRLPNRLALTPLGTRLLGVAAAMEENAAALERLATAAAAAPGRPVRVTATTAVALFLTDHLDRLRAAAGGSPLELVNTRAALSLAHRDAEIALRMRRPPERGDLTVRRIGRLGRGTLRRPRRSSPAPAPSRRMAWTASAISACAPIRPRASPPGSSGSLPARRCRCGWATSRCGCRRHGKAMAPPCCRASSATASPAYAGCCHRRRNWPRTCT